jgi:hypothetical protein
MVDDSAQTGTAMMSARMRPVTITIEEECFIFFNVQRRLSKNILSVSRDKFSS